MDFIFYVIRAHQLHASTCTSKQNKNELCVENINLVTDKNVCVPCVPKLVCQSNICYGNLNHGFPREQSKESAMSASAWAFASQARPLREKFDSAASLNFYGSQDQLRIITEAEPILIDGFTDQHQAISNQQGLNQDGKISYIVNGMPQDLALLSAHAYAQEGAAILFPNDGVVLKLSNMEIKKLKQYIEQFPQSLNLKVSNNTYEVDRELNRSSKSQQVSTIINNISNAQAFSTTASRFFNTKVNVSNNTQRILTMLLTGLSFNDLYTIIKNGSVNGLPPDLKLQHLNTFSHRYGRTPDILRLANAQQIPNRHGLLDDTRKPTFVGERVEVDIMESDYNDPSKKGVSAKLPTWGGATSAAVCVDSYSGFVIGKLLKNMRNTVEFLKEFVQYFKTYRHKIAKLAADSGIVSQSTYQVWTPEAASYLLSEEIEAERSEPNNHERGSPTVERMIRMIKEQINMAIIFLIRNPNFHEFGFDLLDIYKLWGELFFWSIVVINLKPCPHCSTKTRFEVFFNKKPNFQQIRLLPIFSVILVLQQGSTNKDFSNRLQHRLALYVGPSRQTPGAIRAAVKGANGIISIITTSRFTPATDGGGLFGVHEIISRGIALLTNQEDIYAEEAPPNKELTVPPDFSLDHPENDENDSQSSRGVNLDMDISSGSVSQLHQFQIIQPVTSSPPSELLLHDIGTTESDKSTEIMESNIELVKSSKKVNVSKKKKKQTEKRKSNKLDLSISNSPNIANNQSNLSNFLPTNPAFDSVTDDDPINHASLTAPPTLRRSNRLRPSAFIAWTSITLNSVFLNFDNGTYYEIKPLTEDQMAECYAAVKVEVPKSFQDALRHPIWQTPAQVEWNQFFETGSMVEVDSKMAYKLVAEKKAEMVILFPVFEKKIKDGKEVLKVRLVADGSKQSTLAETFASTPSREELFIILTIVAIFSWILIHVDEIRAFLNSINSSDHPIFAKFRKDHHVYQILKALYGLKTSPRDYQRTVRDRLLALGFDMLHSSQCLFLLVKDSSVIILYVYVDDFIFTGNDLDELNRIMAETRMVTSTTSPIINPTSILGMEIERSYEKKTISITMTKKITNLAHSISINTINNTIKIPIPQRGFIINQEKLTVERDKEPLDIAQRQEYLRVVGSLIWISGVRPDILFATMFLSWNTKLPLQHHQRMAHHLVQYLFNTKDMPMILGGQLSSQEGLTITSFSDASLGTAPKGKSVIAHLVKVNELSASIVTKAKATTNVYLSSFEAELDAYVAATKSVTRIKNILSELKVALNPIAELYCDNLALVDFIKGNGEPKGLKHIALRLWAARDDYNYNQLKIQHLPGAEMPADALTKVKEENEFYKFREIVLGHALL